MGADRGSPEVDQNMDDTVQLEDQSGAEMAEAPSGDGATPEERLKLREQQVSILDKKLAHLRSWMASVQTQMAATNPQLAKNARRLYIGGVPTGTTEEELYQFFAGLMNTCGAAAEPGAAIGSCKITSDKGYAFLELRSAEEASNAMAFDGVKFKDTNLKVRRPSNYDGAAALLLGPVVPDPTLRLGHLTMCKTVVEDSWSKVFVGGLPSDWSDDQVKELLKPYGQLKSFNLVMDKATGKSKGYCFCEFEDDASVEAVITGLHMKSLNRKMLTVKRALDGPAPNRSHSGGSDSGSMGSRRNSSSLPLGAPQAQRDGGAPGGGGGVHGGAVSAPYGPRGGGGPGGGMLFNPHQAAVAAAAAQQQQHGGGAGPGGGGGPYHMGLPPPPHPHSHAPGNNGSHGWRGKPLGAGGPPGPPQQHGHDAAAAMASSGMVVPGMFGFGPPGAYPHMQHGPMNNVGPRPAPIQPPPGSYNMMGGAPGGPGSAPGPTGAPPGGASNHNSPPTPSQPAPLPSQPSPASSGPMYEPPVAGGGGGGVAGGGAGAVGFANGPGPLPATSSLPGGVASGAAQDSMAPQVSLYASGSGASEQSGAQQGAVGGAGEAAAGQEAFSPHVHHQQQGFMAPPLASSYW